MMRLFYYQKLEVDMATDVDVQFFSHLNGLVLGNNWGDMIRLLDTCLVNGLPLTSITSATVDAQGDITLNLYAAHDAMLFQIVELSGFAPTEFNGKYRIKGTPTSTQLILKAEHIGKSIITTGAAKLASLGYEIAFRDAYDVKRAYRAIDPTAAHPFIRIDESLSGEGGGTYNESYAKSAMVGLIENMTYIDDYADANKLQLPLDTSDLVKNWKITGVADSVVRGWSRWYWAHNGAPNINAPDSAIPSEFNRQFTITGSRNAFYILANKANTGDYKHIMGCGVFNSALSDDVIPSWFLLSAVINKAANNTGALINIDGGLPFVIEERVAQFFTTRYRAENRLTNTVAAQPIVPDYATGNTIKYAANNVPALEIPFGDINSYLRGTLPIICYAGKKVSSNAYTTPILGDKSMYVWDSYASFSGLLFYMGELE